MKDDTKELDFQIEFYERILKDKPDFVDALTALGHAYTKRGYYSQGLSIDKKLSRLKKDDPNVHYNLACSYSLIGNIKGALKSLTKAIHLGYDDCEYIAKDPDLKNVRNDRRFLDLLEFIKNKSCKKSNQKK